MKEEKISFFDKDIDPECVPLIVALNSLEGIETFESCCGHLKDNFRIWFRCNSLTSLAIIARTFDSRYSDGKWEVNVDTSDSEVEGYKTFAIFLHTIKPFENWKEMFKSVNEACFNLNKWNQDKWKDHFNGIKDKEFEKEIEERRLNNQKFKEVLEELSYPSEELKDYILAKVDYLYGYRTLYITETLKAYEKGKNIEVSKDKQVLGFSEWLFSKYATDCVDFPYEGFVIDIKNDKNFPKGETNKDKILDYLISQHACDDCLKSFEMAFEEYKKEAE